MKKRKKVLATLLTVTTCMAALAGCGKSPAQSETDTDGQVTADGTETAQTGAQASDGEEITIDFWHHYSAQSPENETLMNVLIPKFEEETRESR